MKKACKANLPAMIFLFALLILWQAGAMGLDAAYILPSPTQILAKLWELRDVLFTVHLPATMLVTAIGLGISLVLVYVVLGGLGNIWGSIVATVVLYVLPEALRQFSDYRMLVYAIVPILVMLATNNPQVRTLISRIIPRRKGAALDE